MVVVNSSGSIVLVNQQTERLFGYTRSELLHKPVEILIPERFHSQHPKHRQLFLSESRVRPMGQNLELYGRRKNGTEFPVEISLSPIETDQGLYVATAIRDATVHKQLEQSLTGILENSLNEIYIFDAESLHFIQVNKGARLNIGYTIDELKHLTPVDIKPELTAEQFDALITPLKNGDKPKIEFESIHQRKDGTTYPVEVHLQSTLLNAVPVYFAIILDITERKEAERILRESHDLLELRVSERTADLEAQKTYSDNLVSTLQGIVLLLDENANISFCNSYFEALSGYDAAEITNQSWIETFIPEAERAGMGEYFKNVLREGLNYGYVNPIVLKNGEQRQIQWYSRRLDGASGLTHGLLCTGYDVTEQIANTNALETAKKDAEMAAATKSRFLAAASHDLRQPLQSLGLYMSVMMRQLDQPDLLDVGRKMRLSLDTMGELLDALLDISKLESGGVAAHTRDVQLEDILQRIVADNVQQAEQKGLTLECVAEPCVIHTDPGLLERIVENFVTNAIRYTDDGKVRIECECSNDVASIMVTDTGIGIPEKELSSIFEEYYQLENNVRDRRKGLGLGLSIVKHIGRLLDHPVRVSSKVGDGSIFSVDVPLGNQAAHTDRPAEEQPRRNRGQAIVLFVDDDPAIVDATSMLLRVSGFCVHSALNGKEAMAHVEAGVKPDVVVSDFRLPGANGIEVVQQLRQAIVSDVPTILITGDTSGVEIQSANLANCTVLHKPVDTDRLISLLESLTE